MSIYVFCDLYPKLQIQLQQFTESYSDFDCYWMESMGNLNFWIMSDQIVEKIYACVIFIVGVCTLFAICRGTVHNLFLKKPAKQVDYLFIIWKWESFNQFYDGCA